MKTVTTKAIAKVAAVATGLAMATSMLSLAPMAHAAGLTSSQVQSILSLLSSFGADSGTIANVNAALTGGSSTSSGSTTTTTSSACSFSGDLTVGSSGAAVTCLQQALIAAGYSVPAGATGYFGAQTQSAVSAWQKAVGVSPSTGYFGAISRAHWNLGGGSSSSTTTTTTTTTTNPGTGNGLKVALSATSPNGSVLVNGQGIGDLGDFVFGNPTSAPINVTGLTFNRTGVSNDSTLANVYLYSGVTRLTDSAGVSNGQFSYSNPAGIFTIPAGTTYTVSVRSDIAPLTSGQQIGVSLVSVSSSGTLDSSVSLPIMGGYQTISAASLAHVDYSLNPQPQGSPSISPQNDYPVFQDTVSVSTNPVKLTSLKFTNLGSIDPSYIINLRLYVDGVQVGAAVPTMNGNSVLFDLSASPLLLSTQSHVVKVLANITGGASRTILFSVQRSSDAMFVDSQLNQPVTPTYNSATFSAVSTSAVNINSVGTNSGVSVSLDPSSPTQAVAVGASSVEWVAYDMLASGENVKVSDLYLEASSTTSGGAVAGAGGMANGKVLVNGVQVGSTKTINQYVVGDANKTDFSLGSSLILPAGQTVVVAIYGDAKDSANANFPTGSTETIRLYGANGLSNGQGQSSLNSTSVPAASAVGSTVTVTSSTLSASLYSGYGNQTIIAGSQNARIGAFTLSAGSTEGVTVNTIAFSFATGNSASLTNLTLKDDSTGAVLGSVVSTPNDTSNSFSVNLNIPASGSKTIDIYANILSGANPGTIKATLTTSTAGTGNVTGQPAQISGTQPLQNITIGNATLNATLGAGNPTSKLVIAGSSATLAGQFNFSAQYSQYNIDSLAILIPWQVATSVSSVSLSYTDVNGAVQNPSAAVHLAAGTSGFATAIFTGLTYYVPADGASNDSLIGAPPHRLCVFSMTTSDGCAK